jgi:hypothetical protein
MIDPNTEEARHDFILEARLRHSSVLADDVERELEAEGVDFTEEITFPERMYALESDNRDLRAAVVAWHNAHHDEELGYRELCEMVEADPINWH